MAAPQPLRSPGHKQADPARVATTRDQFSRPGTGAPYSRPGFFGDFRRVTLSRLIRRLVRRGYASGAHGGFGDQTHCRVAPAFAGFRAVTGQGRLVRPAVDSGTGVAT